MSVGWKAEGGLGGDFLGLFKAGASADTQGGRTSAEEINADTLDSTYTGKIDFIKMDVEGHERFVFEGFSEEARNCPLLVVELGSGQPDEFLVELNDKYTMEFLNGEAATFERIKEHDVVNVLLRRR